MSYHWFILQIQDSVEKVSCFIVFSWRVSCGTQYGLFRRKNEFIMKFKFASLSKHDFGAFTLRLWNHSPTPIEIIQLVHNADLVPTRTNSQSKRRMSENQIKYDPGYGAMECMPRKIDRCSGNGFLCINTLTEEGF